MSTSAVHRQQNDYILSVFKNAARYDDLVVDVIEKLNQGIKFKNPKNILYSLRELCMHIRSYGGFLSDRRESQIDALSEAMITALKNTSDNDTDKKIVRTIYYLLTHMMVCYPRKSMLKDKNVAAFLQHLQYSIKQQEGFRLCMTWKLLCRATLLCCESTDNTETLVFAAAKDLKYPPDVKKSIFGNKKAEDEFDGKLQYWTAIFSSLRRLGKAPTPDMIEIILRGCRSVQVSLVRHAFFLLKECMQLYSGKIGKNFTDCLQAGDFLSRATGDVITNVHFLSACQAVILCPETTVAMMESTLTIVFKMLESTRLKVKLEAIRVLTETALVHDSSVFLEASRKIIGGAMIIARITTAIAGELESLVVPRSGDANDPPLPSNKKYIGSGELVLGPLCRAVVRLGRFLVLRIARLSDPGAINTEVNQQEKLVEQIMKILAILSNGFSSSHAFLPHAWSEVLKAMLWLLPQQTDSKSTSAKKGWDFIRSQALAAIPCIGDDLSENLILHVLGRLRDTAYGHMSNVLMELSISLAEESVRSFNESGGVAVGILILVWTKVSEYGKHQTARNLLLLSLLRVIDGELCMGDQVRNNVGTGQKAQAMMARAYFSDQKNAEAMIVNLNIKLDERGKVFSPASHEQELQSFLISPS